MIGVSRPFVKRAQGWGTQRAVIRKLAKRAVKEWQGRRPQARLGRMLPSLRMTKV